MFIEPWQIVVLVTCTLICGILSRFTWSYRSENEPAARAFSLFMGVVALRAFLYLLALTTPDDLIALTWARFRFLFIAIAPVIWLFFVLALVRRTPRHGGIIAAALLIIPLFCTWAAWTNDQHGLFWAQDVSIHSMLAIMRGEPHLYAPLGFFFNLYSDGLIFASALPLLAAMRRSAGMERLRYFIVLLSIIPVLVTDLLAITGVIPYNINGIGFTISALLLSYGMLRLHLLGILPLARSIYVQHTLDAVLVTDQHQRIIDANPTAYQVLRLEASQLIDQPLLKVLPLLPAEATKASLQTEITLRSTDGLERYFETQTYPMRRFDGTIESVVIRMHDVTSQRAIEMQLRQQNEELRRINEELITARRLAEEANVTKGQFLSTMSHELRTPLHIMLGFTELMMQDYELSMQHRTGLAEPLQRHHDFLARVLTSGKNLLTMINGLIDLSQLERGEYNLNNQPFNLRHWFNAVIEHGQALAHSEGIGFESHFDPNLPIAIIGDRLRLLDSVNHLISNAFKFTSHGTVTVEARQLMPSAWVIQVIDTGIGIPAEQQSAIFETFRQVDSSSTRRYGGMGVGLSLVRRIALLMGGQISVQSEVGKGSTFTLILPMVVPTAEPAATDVVLATEEPLPSIAR